MVDLTKGMLLNQAQQSQKPTELERKLALQKINDLPYGPQVLIAGSLKLEETAAAIVAKIMMGDADKQLVEHAAETIESLVIASNGLRQEAEAKEQARAATAGAAADAAAIANEVKP